MRIQILKLSDIGKEQTQVPVF